MKASSTDLTAKRGTIAPLSPCGRGDGGEGDHGKSPCSNPPLPVPHEALRLAPAGSGRKHENEESGYGLLNIDPIDKVIINALQDGFPVVERPYAEAAARIGISEAELIARLERLLTDGVLSRFGPMYHAEQLGGALTLAAMQVPSDDFDRAAAIVNGFPEVAHNYAREHALNMWFVIATEKPERVAEVIDAIEQATGCRVYDMPKRAEFYVGLRFNV